VKSIVDLPCGTGRFTGHLARAGYQVVGSDISMEMMQQAAKLPSVQHANIKGYVRADAEALPFAAKSVDCLLSIRFLFHVDPDTRRRMLREFGRVSRRYIIADYRHKYSVRYGVWRLGRALGLSKRPFERVSVKSMKSEFEDAGLRVLEIIAVRRWLSDKWVVLAESGHIDPESLKVKLRDTQYADLEVTDKLGEGKRSVVYRARWRGRDVGLKVYKPAAIARHARKHELPLAEFEHRRNRAFFEARGMAKYVAEPLGFVVEPGFQMSLQECLDGEVYYFAQREHATFISPRFMEDLAELVSLSHQARLYDIDLHAMNVMVDRKAGTPKLFDFNQIPFTERPQNPLVGLALRMGLLGRESRDLRKLARFKNFDRVERKLLKFYKEEGTSKA
jgi:ubiquinone/menaquinone biosynthesis C-methylase UbiE